MSQAADAAFEQWVDEARRIPLQQAADRAGAKLRKVGIERVGPCPMCKGHDRFSINLTKNVFNCRGAVGGDAIALVMHVKGMEFTAACEWLNGCSPPGRGTVIDHEAMERRRQEAAARQAERDREMARETERKRHSDATKIERYLSVSKPIQGTHAHAYLRARGILVSDELLQGLRFCPRVEYWGVKPGEEKSSFFGAFPAMLAEILKPDGERIGLHVTYLDPEGPVKLAAGGDNKPKKMWGSWTGGAIYLGPCASEHFIMGEGIETSLAYYRLFGNGESVVSAAALGNFAKIELPSWARRVTMLGDNDPKSEKSEKDFAAAWTLAGARFCSMGISGTLHKAPTKTDWADVNLGTYQREMQELAS